MQPAIHNGLTAVPGHVCRLVERAHPAHAAPQGRQMWAVGLARPRAGTLVAGHAAAGPRAGPEGRPAAGQQQPQRHRLCAWCGVQQESAKLRRAWLEVMHPNDTSNRLVNIIQETSNTGLPVEHAIQHDVLRAIQQRAAHSGRSRHSRRHRWVAIARLRHAPQLQRAQLMSY